MPTLSLGDRLRQFKQLQVLQRRHMARRHDPLSAYQYHYHYAALRLVEDILTQEWSMLLLERFFLQSRLTFTEYLPRTEVVSKLLAALESYEKCLTHQAADSSRVRYDLKEFECRLFGAIAAIHFAGTQTVHYEAVERPKPGLGWSCTKEYQGWKTNWDDLMDPGKGKLKIKEWKAKDIGLLMDGLLTVTFVDGDGEDAGEAPLAATLPPALEDLFKQEHERVREKAMEADAEISETDTVDVPQGRGELAFRFKRETESALVKTEDDGNGDVLAAPEQKPAIRMVLRRKHA